MPYISRKVNRDAELLFYATLISSLKTTKIMLTEIYFRPLQLQHFNYELITICRTFVLLRRTYAVSG